MSTKVAYCTVLTKAFVPRAVALQKSIRHHCPDALFIYYCVDNATAAQLQALDLDRAMIVAPAVYETEQLGRLKTILKTNEYCWSCKPVVLRHALNSYDGLDWAVWLDADMFVFGKLDQALADAGEADVALTPHAFSLPEFKRYEPVVGRFNAGFVAFRNSQGGRAALDWWLTRCLEGCPAVPIDGKYADQKYLDEIPVKFSRVAELHSGVNAAPWNIFDKKIESRGGQIVISGYPLLLYHFQGLRIIRHWIFDLYAALCALPRPVRRLIYAPYTAALAAEMKAVATRTHSANVGVDNYVAGLGGFLSAARHLLLSRNIQIRLISN
jgi:hypothetical protein